MHLVHKNMHLVSQNMHLVFNSCGVLCDLFVGNHFCMGDAAAGTSVAAAFLGDGWRKAFLVHEGAWHGWLLAAGCKHL